MREIDASVFAERELVDSREAAIGHGELEMAQLDLCAAGVFERCAVVVEDVAPRRPVAALRSPESDGPLGESAEHPMEDVELMAGLLDDDVTRLLSLSEPRLVLASRADGMPLRAHEADRARLTGREMSDARAVPGVVAALETRLIELTSLLRASGCGEEVDALASRQSHRLLAVDVLSTFEGVEGLAVMEPDGSRYEDGVDIAALEKIARIGEATDVPVPADDLEPSFEPFGMHVRERDDARRRERARRREKLGATVPKADKAEADLVLPAASPLTKRATAERSASE